MRENSFEVFAVGGCHLNGYLVGEDWSVLSVAFGKSTAIGEWIKVTAPISVKRAVEYFSKNVFTSQTSDLIVQLGNYETGVSLSPFSKRLQLNGSRLRQSQDTVHRVRRYRIRAMLQSFVKMPLLYIYDFLKCPRFSADEFEVEVDSLFTLIESKRFKNVYIISTFPTLQPHLNVYRSRANEKLKNLATKHNFKWIDVFSLNYGIGEIKYFFGVNPYFFDAEHFSAIGHARAGSEISRLLK